MSIHTDDVFEVVGRDVGWKFNLIAERLALVDDLICAEEIG